MILFLALGVGFPVTIAGPRRARAETLRHCFAVIAGLLLLWYESRLPSVGTMWSLVAHKNMRFSPSFVFSFVYRLFSLTSVLTLLTILTSCFLLATTRLARYYAVAGVLCLVVISGGAFFSRSEISSELLDKPTPIPFAPQAVVSQSGAPAMRTLSPDESLNLFFADEKDRSVPLASPTRPDFDIILLQLCSFAWEDFHVVGHSTDAFFGQFDIVFTRFNSADSYSNSAALRLLRGTCGLTPHDELFKPASERCYPFEIWRNLGYTTTAAFNHDGVYSDFTRTLREWGKIDEPLDISSLKDRRTSFDDTWVYDDHAVLSSWLARYATSTAPLALYYNSISLHPGVHGNEKEWWKKTHQAVYRESLGRLTDSVERFFAELRASGRKAVVVVVGEHGTALQGNALQPTIVRDIPLPNITFVPAAIKFFGPGFNTRSEGMRIAVDTPVSYRGLYATLAQFMRQSPFGTSRDFLKTMTEDLPTTPFVAMSENGVVIESNGRFLYKKGSRPWEVLPDFVKVHDVDLNFIK